MPEPSPFFANLQRGSMLLNANRPKDALPFFQAAIAANPDSPQGYAELARCYNEIPTQRSKSIGAINRAISLAPQSSRYHGLKGWFLVCLANYRGAYKAAQAGLAINPTCSQSLNALANAHTKLAQWKKAEAACLRILALNPNDAPGLNLLTQALRHQGRWRESREASARILAQMPNNAFGHANAGFAALAAGDHLRANEHFLESLRLKPHFDLARRGLLQSLRARIWIVRLNARLLTVVPFFYLRLIFIAFVIAALGLMIYDADNPPEINPDPNNYARWGGYAVTFLVSYIYFTILVTLLGNFLLIFDRYGRHALTTKEKTVAIILTTAYGLCVVGFLFAQMWLWALALISFFALLTLSIHYPLLKDRWLRHREKAADSSCGQD